MLDRRARALCLCLAAGALAAAAPAIAQDDGVRNLVTGDDFGDFSGQDLEGGGMATELVREAYTAAGLTPEIGFDDWPTGYDVALAGQRDGAFPWYFLPERTEGFVYTDSIYELVERVFHLEGDPDVPEILGAADLAGLSVCYPAGWGAPPSIQAMFDAGSATRVEPGDMSRCFDLLADGRVDTVLSPQLQGYATVEAHPELDAFDVATANWEVTIRTLSVLLPKALGRERACGDAVAFGAGLATLRANGMFDVVARRWFGPLAQLAAPSERYSLVRRTEAGDETLEGTAIGLSGGRFLIDTGEGGIERVALDELAWIGRAGFDELDASKAWCLDDGDADTPPAASAGDADDTDDADPPVRTVDAAQTTEAAAATDAARTSIPDAATAARTFAVGGPATLSNELVPALLSGWLDRELDPDLAVVGPSNDPREPDRLDVVARGTGPAFAALADGSAELAVVDRPPLPAERRALAPIDAFPSEATEHVFALEAIVPVVHESRARAAIDLDTLRARLAGTAGQGPVHLTEALAASLETGARPAELPAPGAAVRRHPGRADVLAAVAADPDALGLVTLAGDAGAGVDDPDGFAAAGVRAAPLADCGLIHAPSDFAARSEEYPLTRRLYMYYSPGRENGFAGGFVRYAQSEQGQRIVAERDLVDLSIAVGSDADRAAALANRVRAGVQDRDVESGLEAATDGAHRLSTTFRFLTGSARLDARAVRDAERLAGWLQERGLGGDDVRLVGYADSRGGYPRNCELSRQRAASVGQALATEGLDGRITTFGACEEAPVACNATPAGQDLNRRVEVWVRDAGFAAEG